jgi:anti-sigma factor RsiW
MLSEHREFLLSEYLDGGLSPEESRDMEERMAQDAELAAALGELRELNRLLKLASPLPRIRWKELADFISNEVIRTA